MSVAPDSLLDGVICAGTAHTEKQKRRLLRLADMHRARRGAIVSPASFDNGRTDIKSLRERAKFFSDVYPEANEQDVLEIASHEMGNNFAQDVLSHVCWNIFWHRSGTPLLSIDNRMFASLALSDLPDEQPRLPWHAFAVSPPAWAPEARAIMVIEHHVDAHPDLNTSDPLWSVHIHLPNTETLWQCYQPMATMSDRTRDFDAYNPNRLTPLLGVNDREKRLQHLVLHAVANACSMLEACPLYREGRGMPVGRRGAVEASKFLAAQVVHLDFRDRCRQYLSGTGKIYKSRWLVRGHWRNQRCGAGRLSVKRIWIEPFWKGDKNSPVRTKEYKMASRNSRKRDRRRRKKRGKRR